MVDKDAPVKVAAQDEARDTDNRKSIEEMEVSELYKLCYPAILDGRTKSKLGEHGDHKEHEDGRYGKHQPDDRKHSICA